MYEVNESRRSVSALAALDRGAFPEAVARYEGSGPSADAVETLWRAEVAVYLERLEEARAELDRLAAPLDRDLANRAAILRAECAFYERALDEAKELIAPVVQSTWEAGDDQGHLRASLLTARIELRRGNSAEALEKLAEPRRLASVVGNDYYAGFIAHCRGYAYYNLGDYRRAGQCLAEALPLLSRSEGGRWEAACRNLYGSLLTDLGQEEEALAHFERSERLALDLGVVSEALFARNNAAGALLGLDRFSEAAERLRDLLNWERATQHVFAELIGLQTLAMALCELGEHGEAERAARESVQLARLVEAPARELDGELIAAWAAGKAGRPEAAETLRHLSAACDESENDIQRVEVRLFEADVLARTKPDVASRLCAEARAVPACEESRRLKNLLARVERTITEGPIRVGPHGELILDTRFGWPDYDAAVEAVKRFLVLGAVDASEGNRSEAARKLNLTRSRLHDVWHQLHGEPVRPRREAAGESRETPEASRN